MKRWKTIGGGEFVKWETAGQALEGEWVGASDGKFGPVGEIRTESGGVTFPLHTALLDKMQRIRPGVEVRIEYTGKVMGKNGKEYKSFNVMVDEQEENPFVKPREEPGPDADIPF